MLNWSSHVLQAAAGDITRLKPNRFSGSVKHWRLNYSPIHIVLWIEMLWAKKENYVLFFKYIPPFWIFHTFVSLEVVKCYRWKKSVEFSSCYPMNQLFMMLCPSENKQESKFPKTIVLAAILAKLMSQVFPPPFDIASRICYQKEEGGIHWSNNKNCCLKLAFSYFLFCQRFLRFFLCQFQHFSRALIQFNLHNV